MEVQRDGIIVFVESRKMCDWKVKTERMCLWHVG